MPDYLHEIEAQLAALHTAAQQGEMITPEQIQVVREQVIAITKEIPREITAIYRIELRRYLTRIIGYARIIELWETLSEEQRSGQFTLSRLSQIIQGSTDEIDDFSEHMHDFYRELYPVQLSNINTPQFLESIQSAPIILQRLQNYETKQLRIEDEPNLPDLVTNRELLLRILYGLIGDALKYSDDNSHIVLRVGQREKNIQFILTITDSWVKPQELYLQAASLFDSLVAKRLHALGSQLEIQSVGANKYSLAFEIPVWEED